MPDTTITRDPMHVGRSWSGTPLEDDCPCPQEPCGLVDLDRRDRGCAQHDLRKTMRQGHLASKCPGERPAARTRPAVCEHLDGEWRCIGAAGHPEGEHHYQVERGHLDRPLDVTRWDTARLTTELRLAYMTIDRERREHTESTAHTDEWLRVLADLLVHVMRHGAGRSAKHDATCVLRHPSCLARTLWRQLGTGLFLADLTATFNAATEPTREADRG